jgi:hypothetical protein
MGDTFHAQEAMEEVASRPINQVMIERTRIQLIDPSLAPSEMGMFNFYYNGSAAVQQVRRTEILHMKRRRSSMPQNG